MYSLYSSHALGMPVGPGGSVVSGLKKQYLAAAGPVAKSSSLGNSPSSRLQVLHGHTMHPSSLSVPWYPGPRSRYIPWTWLPPPQRSRLPEALASAGRVQPRTAAVNRCRRTCSGRSNLRFSTICPRGKRLFQTCIRSLELREGQCGGLARGFHQSLCSESRAREVGGRSA